MQPRAWGSRQAQGTGATAGQQRSEEGVAHPYVTFVIVWLALAELWAEVVRRTHNRGCHVSLRCGGEWECARKQARSVRGGAQPLGK